VQWEGWLRHTRPDPPTLDVRPLAASPLIAQELTADLARKQRVAANVARLADQYRLEKARQPQLPPAPAPEPAPAPAPTPVPIELPSETARRKSVAERRAAAAQARAEPASPQADAPAAIGGDAFQPQAWTPTARRRR